MKTNVFVDGFNLYYGSLKSSPYKWLDLAALCAVLLPTNQINRIRYFTAPVQSTPGDVTKPSRQQAYIRALQTIPNLTIHYGSFLTNKIRRPLATPITGLPNIVEVMNTEEKGSDVNLATYLLTDGFVNDYEVAVVVSNDSDLAEPLKFVRHTLGRRVGILNPHPSPARLLIPCATFWKQIRRGALARCQFPPVLTDGHGQIHKPPSW